MKEGYLFRRARDPDLVHLPGIERAAAAMFRASIHPLMADAPLSCDHIEASDLVWVACDSLNMPVGFAIARAMPEAIHLHEIDVHPAHARQGIGAGLIDTIARWAASLGAARLTLSTFDGIPWNGPYYQRLGFRRLSDGEISPELQAIRRLEAAAGLPMEHRICMARELGRPTKLRGAGNTSADTHS